MIEFFRFPHTPHLAWLGEGEPRGDKVLSQRDARLLLANEILIEEKIDGANIGLSLGPTGELRVQNRGAYLSKPYKGQFSRLSSWLGERWGTLGSVVTPDTILFGEWCAAKHSLRYDMLPDWFMLFDVYSRKSGMFWSSKRRNEVAEKAGLATVATIARGRFSLEELTRTVLSQGSKYRSGTIEGLIIRVEDDVHCLSRAKLVKPDFSQAIEEHWSSQPIQWNRVIKGW